MTVRASLPHPRFTSSLAATLDRFLQGKRAAGYRYREEARSLAVLDRFLAVVVSPIDPVLTDTVVRAFVARRGTESETTRAHRLTLIREVCRFRALEDPRTFVPGSRFLGIHRRIGVPRVLSLEEGRRFLQACDTFERPRSAFQGDRILGTMLVLLYLTGLRAGEARRLIVADVDLAAAVLRIHDTKFGKSRLVPLAADVVTRLDRYRHRFVTGPTDQAQAAPFFPAPSGQPYSGSAVRAAFRTVLERAKIPHRLGDRALRVHDLRHSFAVLRLTLWYRLQVPLDSLLPALATYLGHVSLASSQRYLQLTADHMTEIARRHAARFGHLITDGGAP